MSNTISNTLSNTKLPRKIWLHLFRALLRQCSYLPDPVARVNMQAYTIDRFRHNVQKNKRKRPDLLRQNMLRKTAIQQLSLLSRANEGYSKPLEKVLQLAYGRRGKRRHELIQAFLAPAGEKHMAKFEDGWEPPSLMVHLLKAQNHNAMITLLNAGLYVKETEPNVPSENIWGRPLSKARRTNIRKEWYVRSQGNMFPPLLDAELEVLEGLMSGAIPWTPPKRRKAIETSPPHVEPDINLALFLKRGPSKGETFEKYVDGRPHVITRRFMQRLWKRLSCLVPRVKWDAANQKPMFTWDVIHTGPQVAISTEESIAQQIFGGVDANGRKIKDDEPQIEPQQSD
ncbi:hypothetical protein BO78DRAFT_307340 [Aspergillus sclerotiicarbonarius CBS 121057]|uniref:LYR motif-containing protein Cup1-like N-terminal domain-containing protein n=1 Tax=Aspergillus sclerotiicarbonarius (strain CBS 121057 / IBT 28362) TaxID=1448318 RepID=A0A319EHZ6_ASPSB|nr:hypothetical protein BO78DRAFT_307340 [Aspergillus sclerotiicarbonarius CBS 121057]